MFAAMGSCASISYIQEKSSACVEVLRKMAHEISTWYAVRDLNRRHSEVSIDGDIAALCLDISMQKIHTFTRGRKIFVSATTKKSRSQEKTAVRDVLLEGMVMLMEKEMFEQWMKRTEVVGSYLDGAYGNVDLEVEGAFADPDGRMEVDSGLDEEFAQECPFSNADIITYDGDN
jgi:hypothetical protein